MKPSGKRNSDAGEWQQREYISRAVDRLPSPPTTACGMYKQHTRTPCKVWLTLTMIEVEADKWR